MQNAFGELYISRPKSADFIHNSSRSCPIDFISFSVCLAWARNDLRAHSNACDERNAQANKFFGLCAARASAPSKKPLAAIRKLCAAEGGTEIIVGRRPSMIPLILLVPSNRVQRKFLSCGFMECFCAAKL